MKILNKLKIRKNRKLFLQLYKNTNGAITAKSERERLKLKDFAFTYGEVLLDPFREILNQAQPKSGEIFADLGSGTGKAVIIAALFFNLQKAYGIELLPGLHQQAAAIKQQLPNYPCEIDFILGDFLSLDFSDANIVFINATGLFGQKWDSLAAKLKKLSIGTRVIITSKQLDSPLFEQTYCNYHLMSWGMCRISTYKKSQ